LTYVSLVYGLLILSHVLFSMAWAKLSDFPTELARLGQTRYPQAFVRIGKHWLVYTYPVGPLVRNGTVLVPIRAFAGLIGAKVEWDGVGAVVYWQGKAARFQYERASSHTWTAPVMLKTYRTLLVPLRALIEPFGFGVDYKKIEGVSLVMVSGLAVKEVDRYVRDNIYPYDTGFNLDAIAAFELDDFIPVNFSLNATRSLPIGQPRETGAFYAADEIYAKPRITFKYLGGSPLKKGKWGIYIPKGGGSRLTIGYGVMVLSDGTLTPHPCAISGKEIESKATVSCQFKTWRGYNGFPPSEEYPLEMILVRVVHYGL